MPTAKRSNESFQQIIEMNLSSKWQADAACSPGTAELFFPSRNYTGRRNQEEKVRRAKKICRDCPVIRKCLNYALNNGLNETDDGIWGGMTPGERRKLKKGQNNL